MATLIARPGDPQAVKAAAVAAAASSDLSIVAPAKATKLVPEGSAPPFGNRGLLLILPTGAVLAEPNAMARYLGASLQSPADLSGETWLEWEEAVLRPAVYSGNVAALEAALRRLPAGGALLGSDLADIVVFSTLRAAALLGRTLSADADAFLAAAGALPAIAAGIEQVAQGVDAAPAKVAAADAAAFAAAQPKLPLPGRRNMLITSALPYVNNVPHLGNIIGCVLSADVYARFCRARGHNCLYVCGTDEYGTATETKALEEGLTCQQICDKYHAIHASIYEWFDIAFDRFGRTPTRAQTEIGQEMFMQLHANGHLVEQTIEQLYSEPLQKFLADRFVVGTCPKCRYEDARGDQCDSCGALLNPTELINPRCKLTGSTPVVKQTSHIFLDLPALSPALQAYIDATSARGGWSPNCVQVTKAWMDQGLRVRCITRDLKWGTPVPLEGYQDKVFYVWFDAPIGYISITASYCGDAWRAWWLPAEHYGGAAAGAGGGTGGEVPEVELVQFMGKDNVPFHTVIFPASQLGTARPWTMMQSISVTEYLNYEDGKFSKSRGVGVFGNDAKDTGIPVEVWRYYLLAVRPETSDAAFQWDDFASKNNADLNDNLGNFVNRTLKFVFARFGGVVPGAAPGGAGAEAVAALGAKVSALVEQYIAALEGLKMKEALRLAMHVSRAGNGFFQETEIWKAYKEDPAAAAAYISACVGVAAMAAALLQPFMPSFTRALLQQLALPEAPALTDDLVARAAAIGELVPAGHKISATEPTPLFRKITDAEVEQFRERFAGNQADRAAAAAAASSSNGAADAGAKKPGKEAAAAQAADSGKGVDKKADKKEKKAVGGEAAGAKKKGGAAAAEERPVDIGRIDLRVGRITKAWRHPDAESLYVEEIDVGEAQPRTVVSGLVRYIPEAEMQGRRVVLVCNLKPANMRGVRSEAMVLAATAPDGGSVELVEPPEGAAPGERVSVEGFSGGGEPDEVLNPKKKVWEAVQPQLATDAERRACYRGVPLATAAGGCTVRSIVGGSIK